MTKVSAIMADVTRIAEPSLRTAQKDLTRSRIREAARGLFFTAGYAATTVEQIAVASGASRATFYLHFKDKEDVLRDIAQDYTPRAVAVMRRFPGPKPTLAQIREWIGELCRMSEAEQASVLIFRQVSSTGAPLPDYVQAVTDQLIAAVGETVPAFRAAVTPGPLQLQAKVRAELLLTEATMVFGRAARGVDDYAAMALDVLAEHFAEFLAEPCFAELS